MTEPMIADLVLQPQSGINVMNGNPRLKYHSKRNSLRWQIKCLTHCWVYTNI